MLRKINFSVGEFYHIYNRGTDKRVIFDEKHDYQRFKALLYVCNDTNPADVSKHLREGRMFIELFSIEKDETIVDVIAYCLMPNHFHLLVHEKSEGGVVKFMSKLSTAYSMYFNNKNSRTGALFEGRFKAKHIDSDEYLKYLFAYIHLNPMKIIEPLWKEEGIKDYPVAKSFLNEYRHSSYLDWQGERRLESNIINRKASPEYFRAPKEFSEFIRDWATFREK